MKNKKYHIVGTYLKSNINIVEKVINGNPNTQMHDRSISWRVTGTLIKNPYAGAAGMFLNVNGRLTVGNYK